MTFFKACQAQKRKTMILDTRRIDFNTSEFFGGNICKRVYDLAIPYLMKRKCLTVAHASAERKTLIVAIEVEKLAT